MAIIARYQRQLSPPASPTPRRQSKNSNPTDLLHLNVHLRTPLPRTDSETRREELAKQLARDNEPVSISSSGGENANYSLAKAVVGRYAESYLPGIREHQAVLERGAGVVRESLGQKRRGRSGCTRSGRREKDTVDSMVSSIVHGVEVEWMVWSRLATPAVALYAWWVVFTIWRKLDDGERDFPTKFTAKKDMVKTWLTWAFVGLVVLLCFLALVVWVVAEVIRALSRSKSDHRQREGDKSR